MLTAKNNAFNCNYNNNKHTFYICMYLTRYVCVCILLTRIPTPISICNRSNGIGHATDTLQQFLNPANWRIIHYVVSALALLSILAFWHNFVVVALLKFNKEQHWLWLHRRYNTLKRFFTWFWSVSLDGSYML